MAHQNMRPFAGVGALAICLLSLSPAAHANLTIISAVGGAPQNVGSVFQNFDSLTPGADNQAPSTTSNNTVLGPSGNTVTVNFSPLDGSLAVGVALGSLSGSNAAPYLSGGNGDGFGSPDQGNGQDSTPYLTTGTGMVTLTFSSNQMYLGLLWGSVDDYNTLTFFENGVSVGSITGTQVIASPTGDQGLNGTTYVNINSDTAFNSVEATSSQNAFEFDNLAYNASPVSVPEPSTLVVAIAGALGMIAYGWRRKGLALVR